MRIVNIFHPHKVFVVLIVFNILIFLSTIDNAQAKVIIAISEKGFKIPDSKTIDISLRVNNNLLKIDPEKTSNDGEIIRMISKDDLKPGEILQIDFPSIYTPEKFCYLLRVDDQIGTVQVEIPERKYESNISRETVFSIINISSTYYIEITPIKLDIVMADLIYDPNFSYASDYYPDPEILEKCVKAFEILYEKQSGKRKIDWLSSVCAYHNIDDSEKLYYCVVNAFERKAQKLYRNGNDDNMAEYKKMLDSFIRDLNQLKIDLKKLGLSELIKIIRGDISRLEKEYKPQVDALIKKIEKKHR